MLRELTAWLGPAGQLGHLDALLFGATFGGFVSWRRAPARPAATVAV